jgi:hypothetical protein
MNTIQRNQVSPIVLSIALLICAIVWFAGAWFASLSIGDLETAPISSLLIVLVMPAVCFSLSVVLLDTNSYLRFSLFTKFAMGTAVLPVILGTFFSIWTVRELFGVSFQNASIGLKFFAALAVFILVAIAGKLTRRCIMNCLSCQEGNGLSS